MSAPSEAPADPVPGRHRLLPAPQRGTAAAIGRTDQRFPVRHLAGLSAQLGHDIFGPDPKGMAQKAGAQGMVHRPVPRRVVEKGARAFAGPQKRAGGHREKMGTKDINAVCLTPRASKALDGLAQMSNAPAAPPRQPTRDRGQRGGINRGDIVLEDGRHGRVTGKKGLKRDFVAGPAALLAAADLSPESRRNARRIRPAVHGLDTRKLKPGRRKGGRRTGVTVSAVVEIDQKVMNHRAFAIGLEY